MTTNLPDLVTFPNPRPVYRIKSTPDYFYVEGYPDIHYPLPSGAFDFIRELNADAVWAAADLARASATEDVQDDNGFFFEANTNRLLSSFTQAEAEESLREEYVVFLELNEEYQANPDDWALAYNWLQKHPAFYHRSKEEGYDWELNDGLTDLTHWVNRDADKPKVVFEAGERVLPEATRFYRDDNLTVYADSFEEAYVLLAKKVNLYFDLNGINTEN